MAITPVGGKYEVFKCSKVKKRYPKNYLYRF